MGKQEEEGGSKGEAEAEAVVGIPLAYGAYGDGNGGREGQQYYYNPNPYQYGMIPANAIFNDPKGVPLTQTIFRDTPAPFTCPFCSHSSLTSLRSKLSGAAVVACLTPFLLGFCFLCPSMDCLWHKSHYCPSCSQLVADFPKSDLCAVMDPPNWEQSSFALPA